MHALLPHGTDERPHAQRHAGRPESQGGADILAGMIPVSTDWEIQLETFLGV